MTVAKLPFWKQRLANLDLKAKSMTKVLIKKLSNLKDTPLPHYATEQSAGMDLSAAIDEPITIKAGEVKIVPTGIAIALPAGTEAQVRPRSGLAAKNGITVLNSPGTVDADYRGEIKAILINHGKEDFVITHGMRIAQMVIAKYEHVQLEEVDSLDETNRGAGGFGSTGH
jgi:dUTP pyrophosphatase